MNFWRKLEASIELHDSLLCVGLDPVREAIPANYASISDFGKAIVDATHDLVCCYKPNIAFYEALGREGIRALMDTLAYIPDNIPVILDAKRNDIASTAIAYAKAAFEVIGADAITINPYFGNDGVQPFLDYTEKGVFILCKTSNPSAGEIQDWSRGGEPLYRHVADLAKSWAGEREIGLVIGATYPEAIADIRIHAPNTWFLIPGIGPQGGELKPILEGGLRADGFGLIINASRSIIYAESPREAAVTLRAQINTLRDKTLAVMRDRSHNPTVREVELDRLARGLFEAKCVRFGDFTLHSGAHSPIYVDLRLLVSYPKLLMEVARVYAELLAPLKYDRIAAIPYAALPIGAAVSLYTGAPLIYPRREVKSYGTQKLIEGEYAANERIVLLDDLVTSGASKVAALQPLLAEGLLVKDIIVLVDREQGGTEDLTRQGYTVHAALTLHELVESLERQNLITADEAHKVRVYIGTPNAN